jgi:hypothetical protein
MIEIALTQIYGIIGVCILIIALQPWKQFKTKN